MMMNNNDNKSSTGCWTHRLFNKAGASLTATQHKTYFTYRYHNGHALPESNQFSALFSEANKQQTNQASGAANCQQLFEDGSPGPEDFPATLESIPAGAAKPSQIQGTRFGLASGAAFNRQLTVLTCYDETPDTKTFQLGALNGQRFDYLPGQYLTLSVVIAGREYTRSYGLASSPSRPQVLELTVKRAPDGGIISNWLNDHLKVGGHADSQRPFWKIQLFNKPFPKNPVSSSG
jgi:hypothetical protein